MREQRYAKRPDGITRIKSVVKKYRTSGEPDDPHDKSARYLCMVLEDMSVNPDLSWASALIVDFLHKSRLCARDPVGDGTKSIFTVEWPRVAESFRAVARKKKRN